MGARFIVDIRVVRIIRHTHTSVIFTDVLADIRSDSSTTEKTFLFRCFALRPPLIHEENIFWAVEYSSALILHFCRLIVSFERCIIYLLWGLFYFSWSHFITLSYIERIYTHVVWVSCPLCRFPVAVMLTVSAKPVAVHFSAAVSASDWDLIGIRHWVNFYASFAGFERCEFLSESETLASCRRNSLIPAFVLIITYLPLKIHNICINSPGAFWYLKLFLR